VQGLFGGVLGPQISGYIQNAFPRAERGRAFGRLGLTVGVATALGPVVGGLLIALGGEQFGWRLVFFINVPIGLTAIVLALAWVREAAKDPGRTRARLDVPGAILLGSALLLLLFPIVEYSTFRTGWLFLLFAPAAVFALVFLRRENRLTRGDGSPLLDVRLFRQPTFTIGVVFILLYFCGSTGLPLVLTFYLQQGIGFAPLQAALAVTALAVGSAISAPIAGRLVPRIGRPLVVAGVVLFIVGAGAIALVVGADPTLTDPGTIILRLALPLFLIGIGGGAVITPNQTLSLADVDRRIGGSAGGVLQTSQRVGVAIGQASIGAVFFAVLAGATGSTALGSPARDPAAWSAALGVGVIAALGFATAALALGLADLRATRRRRSPAAVPR
jgi:MFS family permease